MVVARIKTDCTDELIAVQVGKPVRVRRSYTQSIKGSPDDVFPLLCPVREVEWVQGWEPRLVISDSGVVERNCVFVTPDQPSESIWVTTRCEPDHHRLEFIKVTPGLAVGRIEISLEAAGEGGTHAHVAYEYTALGYAGEKFVGRFTETHYEDFMKEWESELNSFLGRA